MRTDGSERLLSAALRLLPPDRRDWGAAMGGELATVQGRGARWRFAWGCLIAVAMTPPAGLDSVRRVQRLVGVGAAGAGVLVAFALVRYPGLRDGTGTMLAVLAFLGVLLTYQVVARLVMTATPRAGATARMALVAAVVTAGCWALVGAATFLPAATHTGLVAVMGIVATPLVVGAYGTRRSRSMAVGRAGAVLTGLVSGLTVFLVWVGQTVATGGRPYDAGQVRDFATSGAKDLATYAVSDNLGAAMVLLVLVPLVVSALGMLGSLVGTGRTPPPVG